VFAHILMSILVLTDQVGGSSDISVLRTFENPGEVSDNYLSYPYSMDFAPDGRLFVADFNQSKVLIWDKDGKFLTSFGTQGEGPGELFRPVKLSIVDDEVWVWDMRRRFSIFDLNGKFHQAVYFNHTPWNFVALSKDKALLGLRTISDKGEVSAEFRLLNRDGSSKVIKSWVNESFIRNVGDAGNSATIKAFASEVDIQRDGQGLVYFGFSQEKTLYKMNAAGEIVGEWTFELPDLLPTEEDKALLFSITFPTPDGQRIGIKNFPGIKLVLDKPKSPYTQFLIDGDRVLLVQTPIGSFQGLGNGFAKATYFVNDLKTGKPLQSGKYSFPEDSTVLYRNGRILACTTAGASDYVIQEIAFKNR